MNAKIGTSVNQKGTEAGTADSTPSRSLGRRMDARPLTQGDPSLEVMMARRWNRLACVRYRNDYEDLQPA